MEIKKILKSPLCNDESKCSEKREGLREKSNSVIISEERLYNSTD